VVEDILNWLWTNSPTLGIILIVLLGLLFFLQLLKDVFDIKLGKIISDFFKKEVKIIEEPKETKKSGVILYSDIDRFALIDELENDDFFQEMKKFRQAHILSMDFGSPNKNIILRDIIFLLGEPKSIDNI